MDDLLVVYLGDARVQSAAKKQASCGLDNHTAAVGSAHVYIHDLGFHAGYAPGIGGGGGAAIWICCLVCALRCLCCAIATMGCRGAHRHSDFTRRNWRSAVTP